MPKIALVGAGPAGLIFTYGLLRHGGYDVTVYSDRTADDWLNKSAPTGTAALYESTIDIERDYGMDHWADTMHPMHGVLFDFKPKIHGDMRLTLSGLFKGTGGAIDQRMRVHHWLNEIESLGAKLVIEAVTPERLDRIALENDLTVLAAGKADLGNTIPRDVERSVYGKPQRNLSMAIFEGGPIDHWDDRADFNPVKFNFYADTGEYFWVPYTHKTAGKTWCVLWEAKPGGDMDIFNNCQSAQDMHRVSMRFIEKHAPWEWDVVKGMRVIEDDPYSWLKGRFPPTVRQAYGELPSGGLVMPIGDTAITFDPIGGQGGNCASRSARFTAEAVIAHGDKPFDRAWMSAVRDGFWDYHGKAAYTFNNILLEPLTEAGLTMLVGSAMSRPFSDEHLIGNFPTPRGFFPYMDQLDEAVKLVTAKVGPQAIETRDQVAPAILTRRAA